MTDPKSFREVFNFTADQVGLNIRTSNNDNFVLVDVAFIQQYAKPEELFAEYLKTCLHEFWHAISPCPELTDGEENLAEVFTDVWFKAIEAGLDKKC